MERVTVKQLMSMRSGLQDYDDDALMQWTYDPKHAARDFSPFDFLHTVNTTALCTPGTCGSYSSVGFVLLGLILSWHSGSAPPEHWQDYDQRSVLPPASRKTFYDDEIHFAMQGKCSANPKIIQQYAWYKVPAEDTTVHFFDIDDMYGDQFFCLSGRLLLEDVVRFHACWLKPIIRVIQ
jgi:CubicO group peptidase (beta-lactamase class C family)